MAQISMEKRQNLTIYLQNPLILSNFAVYDNGLH